MRKFFLFRNITNTKCARLAGPTLQEQIPVDGGDNSVTCWWVGEPSKLSSLPDKIDSTVMTLLSINYLLTRVLIDPCVIVT